MSEKKATGGLREFFTVTGIAVVIAGVMTLLAVLPPLSGIYGWLEKREMTNIWTALTAGVIGGTLSFYRAKEKEKEGE